MIRSVPGTRIVITFPDFNLESSFRCYGDVIAISDGTDENAPSLGKFCGSKVDPQVNSSGNSVFIRFKSDFSTSARGFRLFWKVERLPTSAPPTTTPKSFTTVKKSREGEGKKSIFHLARVYDHNSLTQTSGFAGCSGRIKGEIFTWFLEFLYVKYDYPTE